MKLKKYLIMLICLIAMIIIPNIVNADVDDTFTVEGMEYIVLSEENNYTVQLCEYNGSDKSVLIPETVTYNDNIYIVKEIGNEAFLDCTTLESVAMPDSIISTWYDIFRGCTSLKEVQLSNSLKLLQYGIFGDCTSLQSVIIPKSIKTIDMRAFENCTSLNEVKILNPEAKIDENAFKGCTSLNKLQGYIRSTAETYAKEQEYDFEIIGKFNILFDANGGTFSNNEKIITITSGKNDTKQYEVIEKMEEPTKEGYEFIGYYTVDGTSFDSYYNEAGIDKKMEFYAKWKPNNPFMEDSVNQAFAIGGDKTTLSFTLSIEDTNKKDRTVYVDGDKISMDAGDYTSQNADSYPYITLSEDYMKTLKTGTHTIKIVLKDGTEAETTFEITNATGSVSGGVAMPEPDGEGAGNVAPVSTSTPITTLTANNPQTGDNIWLFVGLLGISIAGIFVTIKFNKSVKK